MIAAGMASKAATATGHETRWTPKTFQVSRFQVEPPVIELGSQSDNGPSSLVEFSLRSAIVLGYFVMETLG